MGFKLHLTFEFRCDFRSSFGGGDAKTESRTPSFIHAFVHFLIQRACLNVQPLISSEHCRRVLHISAYLFFKVIYFCQTLTVPSDLSSRAQGNSDSARERVPTWRFSCLDSLLSSIIATTCYYGEPIELSFCSIVKWVQGVAKDDSLKPCRRRWNKRLSLPFMSYSRFILPAYSMGNLGPLYSTYFNHEWCSKGRRLFTVM